MIPIIEAETERLVGVYHGGTLTARHRDVLRIIVGQPVSRRVNPAEAVIGHTNYLELMWLERRYRQHRWSEDERSVWVLSTLPGQTISDFERNHIRGCDMFPPGCWKTK